ncbi:MAG: ATP-binding protein [Ilumatobacteraceae bacterium]
MLAEAAAGETGKPFVFVDPGAFINMFMGVGILKVKGLFRKLRKLALRYGGVVVFFDEADSLGNRGLSMGPQPAATPFGNFLRDRERARVVAPVPVRRCAAGAVAARSTQHRRRAEVVDRHGRHGWRGHGTCRRCSPSCRV